MLIPIPILLKSKGSTVTFFSPTVNKLAITPLRDWEIVNNIINEVEIQKGPYKSGFSNVNSKNVLVYGTIHAIILFFKSAYSKSKYSAQ